MKNSRHKSIYAGTKEIADGATGEITTAVVLKQQRQDRNYIKMFLPTEGYQMRPKQMTLASVDLFNYLCVIMDSKNVAIMTKAETTDRIGISPASYDRAKEQLRVFDYIRRRANNIYMVNPEMACKVDGDKRQSIWENYKILEADDYQ